jgi:membrane protein
MSEPQRLRHGAPLALRAGAEYVVAVVNRFYEDRSLQTASSLAFTTLLALVPLITVALSISTAFPVFRHATDALQRFVVDNLLPQTRSAHVISEQIAVFSQKAGKLTAVGLAFLAVTSIMLMYTIDMAMNRIFRVIRHRPLMQRLLMYWAVLTLGPVLIGASLSATTLLVGQSLGMFHQLGWLADHVLRMLATALTCAALTMLYLVVPYRRVRVSHALVGGLVAGFAFELAKRGFAFYVQKFPTYALIYGAFAAVPIFLVWIYTSWVVVLAGATITAMLPAYRAAGAERRRAAGQDLVDALGVLRELARAQESGESALLARIARSVNLLPYRCERVLQRCAALGWAARAERDAWLLTRDSGSIRLADIYRAFVLDPQPPERSAAEAMARLAGPLGRHWEHVEADLGLSLKELAARAP